MQLEPQPRGEYLLIRAKGRLDAAWADYFYDELFKCIRAGQHQVVIDAGELVFLSSAGIRALLRIFKELKTVGGSFLIVNATDFVRETLLATHFESWLSQDYPADMPAADAGEGTEKAGIVYFPLNAQAFLTVTDRLDWQPWQAVGSGQVKRVDFPADVLALGIGSSAETFGQARDALGEFLAVAGNVIYQPPEEQGHADFLIAEKEYIPQMQCLQLLSCRGEPGWLQRFTPTEATPFYPLSELLKDMLARIGGQTIAFVLIGEIEGLVGCFLIRSPGVLNATRQIGFPEIRDWLSFCGERCYPRQQALIVGLAGQAAQFPENKTLTVLPSFPELATHIHGAVFPYQPLQNGKIELASTIQKLFNGPSPLAVMHLSDDSRPVVGLGESALVRGAGWFGVIQNPEVLA